MSSSTVGTANEIFCLYAHQDQEYIEVFRRHLSLLQREGTISCWYDGLIEAGQQRQREIETHLNSANMILLFVSADFFADDLCMNNLPIALERSNRKEALVIPILVRKCDWQIASLAHLQALPKKGKPIATWRHRDEAYTEIAKSIRSFVHRQQVPPMRCSLLNVPFHRNRLFTGREDILQRVHAALESRKETALIQAIKGLGGIGKTQTAIEYAYRYQDSYTRIIWLNSSSRETITSDVMGLAREINTPGCYDQDQNIVVQGFLTWLERQRNWLLILDNVEDMALPRTYMPKSNQGDLLLTTRRQADGRLIEGISLEAMNEETGATFLLKRAKRIAVDLPFEQIPIKEMQPAMNISKLLGGLPLALDQAGGYIERKQCSLERYIQIYEQAHQRLLAESGFPADTTDYTYTVATTWSLSFQQVAQSKYGQATTDLLRLCTFLAPDNIPVVNFETAEAATLLLGSDLGPVIADPFEFEEAVETLLNYSLIRREEDSLFIHQLVQTVLHDAMTEEEHFLWMERAVLMINGVFPSGEHGTWSLCESLLPHALMCAKWVPVLEQKRLEGARLLSATGRYLHKRAQYAEVEPLLKGVLSIYEEQLGAAHPQTGASLNNLAELYRAQGRYAEAEPLYERALTIYEGQLGASHPDTATSLNNLAGLYRAQGRYPDAEPLYERALCIREEQLGAAHPDTAGSLNNLAGLYKSQGRYPDAEPLYKRALCICEEQLGAAHPDTATSLSNLAELYRAQGRYPDAEPLYKRALTIYEEQLGAAHPHTAMSLNNLAGLYESQGRYPDAEPLYKRALIIYEEQLGAAHPETAASLNNLAGLYQAQGRYPDAEPLYERVLTIYEGQLGAAHPHTAMSLNNLAELYQAQGRYAEAEPLYQRALAIREEQLGAAHPHTATSLNNLAALYKSQGRYPNAEPLYKRALCICEEQLGASHPQTATSLNDLAALYESQGRYPDAEPLLKRAFCIREEQLGATHPQTATSLNNLAALYESQGRYPDAEPLLKRALSIREKALGVAHPQTGTSLNNLAGLYQAQGRYPDAEPLLKRALSIYEEQLGAAHPDTATSLNNLAELYRAQGRYPDAEPLLKRALSIYEEQLGAAHPSTATSLNNLAELYKSQGRYLEAEPLLKRAVQVSLASLGMEHPQTKQILMNHLMLLSDIYTNGDLEALLRLLEQGEVDDSTDGERVQE